MAKFITVQGTTSFITHVFAQSAAATNGIGFTGLSFSASGLQVAYIRAGQSAHSLVTLTGSGLNLGTYVSGAWLEVNSGTMPGIYEFHVPNEAVTASGGLGRVVFIAQGNASIAPIPFEIQLDPPNGIFTPILAATTHAGVTIPIVSTVSRVLLTDTVSTVARALLVDTATVVVNVSTATVGAYLAGMAPNTQVLSTTANKLVTDGSGFVTVGTNADKTGYSLAAGNISIRKNSTFPGFTFLMVDTATHNPMTLLAVTGQYSLTGGVFSAMASTGVEISNGWYKIDLAAAELNAPISAIRLTAAGADDRCLVLITQT